MDFDQNMGDLYPFSLAEKLKVITEPSAYYAQEHNPWGRAIIPMEMLSVLFQYRARETAADPRTSGRAVRGPGIPPAARPVIPGRDISPSVKSWR